MDNLKFIKKALDYDLEYWEKASKENPDDVYYKGALDSLSALKEKIKFEL